VEKPRSAVIPDPSLSQGAIFILIILAATGAVDLPFWQLFSPNEAAWETWEMGWQ
jgi:hypothetical protein